MNAMAATLIADRSTSVESTGVLSDVTAMVTGILDGYGCMDPDLSIGMGTSFHEDLELESIDLVTLAGMLSDRYGEAVNLAEYLADLDLEDIISLTVGDIVDYIVRQTGA